MTIFALARIVVVMLSRRESVGQTHACLAMGRALPRYANSRRAELSQMMDGTVALLMLLLFTVAAALIGGHTGDLG